MGSLLPWWRIRAEAVILSVVARDCKSRVAPEGSHRKPPAGSPTGGVMTEPVTMKVFSDYESYYDLEGQYGTALTPVVS